MAMGYKARSAIVGLGMSEIGKVYGRSGNSLALEAIDRALEDAGLTKDQMVRLRNEFGVYGTDTGRMCVAALNSRNIDYVCQAIAKVL